MGKIKDEIIRELWRTSRQLKDGEWEFPRTFRWARKQVHKVIDWLSKPKADAERAPEPKE